MTRYSNFTNIETATRSSASNIASSRALSGKNKEVYFFSNVVSGSVGYVNAASRTDMTQGVIRASSVSTDFSFSGENGFAVVKRNPSDPLSEAVFTRSCSFRQDKDGNLVNHAGYSLMGWALDDRGNAPKDNALLDSLSTVNLNRVNYASKATTEMYVSANLSAKQDKLKGAGTLFKVDKSGDNSNLKESDIIVPEKALLQGATFKMKTTKGSERTFVYGGVAISKQITETSIYGASTIGTQFNVVSGVAGAGQIQQGTGLTITYKGQAYNLKAKNGNADVSQYEFTSLDSLAKAISKIDGLKSNVRGDRLFVSSDGNEAVQFDNYDGSNMKETLGLINIEAEARAGVERFSTLGGFKKKINDKPELYGLEATSVPNGLDIHARVATSGLDIQGSSLGINRFERATIGDGTEKGKSTIIIDSPKHGLQKGDFIKLSGNIGVGVGATNVPAGIYMVSSVDSDHFKIHAIHTHIAPMAAAAPAAPLNVPANTTWQKVAGEKFEPVELPAAAITAVAVADNGAVTITNNGHGLADNDVIYISGIYGLSNGRDITVPAGYYVVNVLGGNTFTIIPSNNIPPAGQPAVVGFSYQKVGTTAGAGFIAAGADDIGNFNTRVMETIAAGGNLPNRIRLYVPNNNYAIRDYFSMEGLPPAGLVIGDKMTIRNELQYQILNRGDGWIEFTVPPSDIDAADGVPFAVGDRSYGDPADNPPQIPIDFRINHYNKACDYLGMQQNKTAFKATYSADDENLSLSGGHHSVDRVISEPMTVIDSLGVEHVLMMNFAKLDTNRWAVEVQARRNAAGELDVIQGNARRDGFIKEGILEFNSDGSFATSGGLNNININWNNGSDTSTININWEQIADNLQGQASKGIRQQGDYNDVIMDGNGHKSGSLTGVDIDQAGYIIGSFSNGQTKKLYRIPVATFDNINGLEAGAADTYRATRDSGPYRLRFAGENGVPNIQSKSIEDSNIDITGALLELSDLGQYSNASFSAARMEREATEKAINNLTR
jgi:flagellar hook-basal body protein